MENILVVVNGKETMNLTDLKKFLKDVDDADVEVTENESSIPTKMIADALKTYSGIDKVQTALNVIEDSPIASLPIKDKKKMLDDFFNNIDEVIESVVNVASFSSKEDLIIETYFGENEEMYDKLDRFLNIDKMIEEIGVDQFMYKADNGTVVLW